MAPIITPPSPKEAEVIIVGAGAFGLSAAYHLALMHGYQNVTVLDSHPFPSPVSAANDINKILEEGDEHPHPHDPLDKYCWAKLHQLARESWLHPDNDTIFPRFYHPTGIIYAAVGIEAFERVREYTAGHEDIYTELKGAGHFKRIFPGDVLTGKLPGWRGFYRSGGAGWVEARNLLSNLYKACVQTGVQFIHGSERGKVSELTFDHTNNKVLGIRTVDDVFHAADHVVLAAGAQSDFLFDFEKQLRPTAWTLAHVSISKDEMPMFRNLPVLYNADRGFFIEPSEGGYLKICDEHPGYINLVSDETHKGQSYSKPFRRDGIPVESAQRMKALLREAMPHLADRPLKGARLCWDADTADRLPLVGSHPQYKNLLFAVGGSGNGLMLMPAIGRCVVDVLENSIDARLREGLRWRPEQSISRSWFETQGRFGADGRVMDLHHIVEWTSESP